jgi:aminopeptidase N
MTSLVRGFVLLVALVVVPRASAQSVVGIGDPLLPAAGNPGYDVQHYAIDLNILSVETGELTATTEITLLPEMTLRRFNLDFSSLDITSLTVKDAPAEFDFDDGELTITPAEPLTEGQNADVRIEYEGTPRQDRNPIIGAGGYTVYEDGIYVAGQPNSAATFVPVNDHPSDKATYSITITVPEPYLAVSNGVLESEVDNGDTTTYVYAMNDPMATYLMTLAVGEFDVYPQTGPDDLPMRTYVPPGADPDIAGAFKRQGEMIEYFETLFGSYPFETAGGIVVDNPRMGFALETQTLPIYSLSMVDFVGELVVVHELAHQWFGNSVSVENWQDIWLNEGFASYAEALWVEYIDGGAALRGYLLDFYQTARQSDVLPGAPTLSTLFDGAVYHRGALTLHALRERAGDEVFFDILRAYADEFRYGNASTEDFVTVAERVSGQSLGALFDAWLFGELPSHASIGI